MERAIGAARRAFDGTEWGADVGLRRRCLEQLQAALRKSVNEIRGLLTAESGMPLGLACAIGVDGPIETLGYWPDLIGSYEFERQLGPKQIMGTQARRVVRKEPAGVVSAITPWNFPFQLNLTKIGAALAAGCTVVLKPAPDTPWSGTLLAAIAAETIKRVSLELGGKSASVILDDADLATAVPPAVGGVCMHAGQGCALATRVLVPRDLLPQVAAIAEAVMNALPYGDPTDLTNVMGPLINRTQYERVLDYIRVGRDEATLVAGGGRAEQFERGFYIQPTLFTDVPPESRIAREEIFGPVVVLIGFEDDDDAVWIANDSTYGLSGAVTGGDVERAKAVAFRLRTGTVAVNGAQWFDPESPFGGYKQSGLGREWGPEGLEDFLETKTVSFP